MKNKKKIISAIVAAVLCVQSMMFVPFTASAAVSVPQQITQNNPVADDMEIPSDDASSADITNISLGGAYTGSYEIKFDMSVSGALRTAPADRNGGNNTYFTIKGSKVGPYVAATAYNEENNTITFTWQTTSAETTFTLNIGERYTFDITVENGSMVGGKAKLVITNEAGETVFSQEGLGLRNYGDGNGKDGIGTLGVVNMKNEPKANIVIGNVWVISQTPDSIKAYVKQPIMDRTKYDMNGTNEKSDYTEVELTTDENIIQIDPFEDSYISYAAEPWLNGAVTTAFETPVKTTLDSEEPGFTVDKTNSRIVTKASLPAGEYDFTLYSQVSGYDDTKIECPIKLVKKAATVEETVEAFKSRIDIYPTASYIKKQEPNAENGEIRFALNNIFEDVQLPTEWGGYDVTWESSAPEVLSETGKVMPKAEDTNVTLTAKIDVDGAEAAQSFNVVVKGAKAGAQAAIDKIVMLNSKLVKIDPTNVKEDFTISAPQYNSSLAGTATSAYRGDYIQFSYEDDKGIINVDENGKATILPTENGNDDVVLKVTATYIKDGVEVEGASVTKEYNLKVTASIASVINEVFNGTVITNADTGKAAELNAISYDINLPESIGAVQFKNWNISNAALKLSKDGKSAQLLGTKIGEQTGTISADVVYKKGDTVLYETTFEKDITAVLSKDMAPKYIVRCDAAASVNFKNCPEDGEKITETSLNLPKEGIFGSDISWSSSVPAAISNTGKVTKQKYAKKVTLTATISKVAKVSDSSETSASASETYTIKDLVVPSTSGSTSTGSSGGSGGGSSTGSSNTNSTVSSTNNKATNVSYKGTLTPNTSLQKGDVTTATVSSFSDLGDAAWAREAVTNLYNKGVINGKTASSFAPNDDITRAEFAKIVVKAFGLEDTAANVSEFSDVKTGDWYYTAVASAYNKGIIKGYANGTFGVNDKITRQDMAVIIYRAAQAANKTIAPVKDGVTFDDSADIASYASEAVAALQKGGIINGMTATTFAPKATATRAQAAQMIYGIVK